MKRNRVADFDNMRYFSTFSGVGGFELGLPKSWECIGFSEIDKYASMVLKYHFQNIKNYGDITKINTDELPDFDLLTGGSPCQDLSIAGKRRGLKGQRSGLFMEYIRILRAKKPRYFIWENVKGALSSNYGFDFAVVLNEMAESGYSLWWQILNAKDFGVPQNRERIFVVGFRDECPKEILFERQGIKKFNGIQQETDGKQQRIFSDSEDSEWDFPCVEDRGRGKRRPSGSLEELTQNESQAYRVYDPNGIATTLAGQAGGLGAKTGLYAFSTNTKQGYDLAESGDGINLAFPQSKTRRGRVIKKNSPTLQNNNSIGTIQNKRVRRLTPIECERLMSWSDNWTKYGIDEKGNKVEISDNQRYKMCGNGVVSKVIEELVKKLLL